MGVEEELEALRKQGVSKKNASDLKDAGGLSTPEAEENAIKAEQERTRIANYGKEASDFLKKPMPTPNDAEAETADVMSEDIAGVNGDAAAAAADDDDDSSVQAAASTQSKDITNLIQITNDFAFVGESYSGDAEDDDRNENPTDCLFGKGSAPGFCPVVDSSVVDGATRSVKGALDEHVVPRLDDATRSVRGALDEHVVPRIDGATMSIWSALDEHVVPTIEKARLQSMETMDGLHRKSMETIDLAKQHSMRTIDSARDETQRLLVEVQTTSQKSMEAVLQQSQALLGEVQTTSQRSVEVVRKQSQVLLDRSKSAMDGVSSQTMAIVNETVKPGYEAVTVTYAPCFLGTATGWTSHTTNTATMTTNTNISISTSTTSATIPWYWLLEEASLRAFGRVVFCDNPVTGIFVWLGILCASPLAAFCALLGVLTVSRGNRFACLCVVYT
jgi:hypothetical protein